MLRLKSPEDHPSITCNGGLSLGPHLSTAGLDRIFADVAHRCLLLFIRPVGIFCLSFDSTLAYQMDGSQDVFVIAGVVPEVKQGDQKV